jgi:hypothetical protein
MKHSGTGFHVSYEQAFGHIKRELDTFLTKGDWIRICVEAAQIAYDKAASLCPVDTRQYIDSQGHAHPGHLLRSLKVETTEDRTGQFTVSLVNSAHYAWYNEYGWSGIPPVPDPPATVHYKNGYRPFMRIGILEAKKYVNAELIKCIEMKGARLNLK